MEWKTSLSATGWGLFAAGIIACGTAEFTSHQRRPRSPVNQRPETKSVHLPCSGTETPPVRMQLTGRENLRLVVEGELCHPSTQPKTKNQLNIVFVVDFSGSMGSNDPAYAGTCGRRRAVEAVISNVDSSVSAGTSVQVGLVSFANNAAVALPLTPRATLRSTGLGSLCEASGYTNYEDALLTAKAIVSGAPGRTAVYFISDGLPTASSGGQSASDELGLAAAEELRSLSKDLNLFAIYLDGPDSGVTGGQYSDIDDPATYLAKLTGSANNVKVVANAGDLATEIVKFPVPDPISVDLAKPALSLSAPGFPTKGVPVARFEKDKTIAGKWTFTTEPIQLYSNDGASLTNTIQVESQTSDGQKKATTLTVDLTIAK